MKNLHIITACSRYSGVVSSAIKLVPEALKDHWFRVRWHIAFQNHTQPDPYGMGKDNEMLDLIPAEDWVWILDDDNLVHTDFFYALSDAWNLNPEKDAIVFTQNRKDGLGPVLQAAPENMKVGRVDTAQVVFKKSLIGVKRFKTDHRMADGIFYEEMFKNYPGAFAFVDLPVVNFNWQK
jgi:hypothetical protein